MSVDIFLGLPFNIASYALLLHMVAQVCDLEPGELIFSGVDVHIYKNHIEQVKKQLSRTPYEDLPTLKLNPVVKDLFEFKMEDISVESYKHHPKIIAPVAV